MAASASARFQRAAISTSMATAAAFGSGVELAISERIFSSAASVRSFNSICRCGILKGVSISSWDKSVLNRPIVVVVSARWPPRREQWFKENITLVSISAAPCGDYKYEDKTDCINRDEQYR